MSRPIFVVFTYRMIAAEPFGGVGPAAQVVESVELGDRAVDQAGIVGRAFATAVPEPIFELAGQNAAPLGELLIAQTWVGEEWNVIPFRRA